VTSVTPSGAANGMVEVRMHEKALKSGVEFHRKP